MSAGACSSDSAPEADVTPPIVYTTNKAVLADNVGRRLENFFWRIWSNTRISRNIQGSQVALLFMSISEGGELRTTPTQSPRSRKHYWDGAHRYIGRSPPPLRNARASSAIAPAASDTEESQGSARFAIEEDTPSKVPRKLSSSQERRRDTRRPPPILKKPKAGSSNHLPKTARILSPTTWKENEFDDTNNYSLVSSLQSANAPPTLSPGNQAAAHVPGTSHWESETKPLEAEGLHPLTKFSSPVPGLVEPAPQCENSQRPGRKKAAFPANTAATKRRPAMVRRKSSQSSSSNASKAPSPYSAAQSKIQVESPPPLPPLSTPLDDIDQSHISRDSTSDTSTVKARNTVPTLSFDTRSTGISRSASPYQSRQSRHPPRGHLATDISPTHTLDSEERAHQDWLVDRDFRSKFVDRTRSSENHGLASLHTQRTKSSAAIATPASYQACGTIGFGEPPPGDPPGKGKAKQGFKDDLVPLKAPGASSEATVDDNDEEDEPQVLPRTKSQLTLLLERDRRMTEHEKKKKKQQQQQQRKTSS